MRSQNNYEQLRETENKSVHVHRSVLLTSTSLSLHKIRSTDLFHTGSSKKHFDFLKVKIRDVPPHNRGFAHFFDLFHNLRNWNIHLCDLFRNLWNWNVHFCDLFHNLSNWNIHDLLQFSHISNQYQNLPAKHRLCVLLNQAVFVTDPFHDVTPQIRTDRTSLDRRQHTKNNLFDSTVGSPLSAPVNLLRLSEQSDSPCLLQLRGQS